MPKRPAALPSSRKTRHAGLGLHARRPVATFTQPDRPPSGDTGRAWPPAAPPHAARLQGGKTMAAPRTRPFIGVNADLVTPAKGTAPFTRLALGYVDAVTQSGGLPLVLPPLAKDV